MRDVRVDASCPVCNGDVTVTVDLDRDERGLFASYAYTERQCPCFIPEEDWHDMMDRAKQEALNPDREPAREGR